MSSALSSPLTSSLDPLTILFLYMAAMFLGAFGAGYLPLAFSLSESRLRLVTIFGAGLLVGTALVVIIPEGIAMHYESQLKHAAAHGGAHAHAHGRRLLDDAHAHGAAEEEITREHPGHWQIGASLALGFAFQLVVGASGAPPCPRGRAPRHAALLLPPPDVSKLTPRRPPFGRPPLAQPRRRAAGRGRGGRAGGRRQRKEQERAARHDCARGRRRRRARRRN